MEEVDKIIIQSLTSLGCEINSDITSIGQFDQDLVVESVAHLLNAINGESSEQFPTKLPPNTGVKFRVCSKFATNCQQLGYKHEIGYQTFLYSNETETRRLLTFLIEKLSKDLNIFAAGGQQEKSGATGKRANKIKQLVTIRVKELLTEFWMPPFIKLNGVKFGKEDELVHEGARGKFGFNTNSLSIPTTSKSSKISKDQSNYFESYCKLITKQSRTNKIDFMASLIQLNAIERVKENAVFKANFNASDAEAKKNARKAHMSELKNAIKKGLNKHKDQSGKDKNELITENDLAEIDLSLQNKSLLIKGSRFTHAQNLQFTQNDAGKNIQLVDNPTEKEEEINNLKEKLKKVETDLDETQNLIDELEKNIIRLRETFEAQVKLNKELEEQLAIRKKTVNLINDAPANILRLKEEIKDHEKKMNALKEKFNSVREPLEKENESLQASLANRQLEYQNMIIETKELRRQIDELNAELSEKEALVAELTQEMASNAKEISRSTNRQFYTKRILEIVETIDKQRKEIEKILIETRAVQKDINQLSGKLERLFNTTDETLYKDAKKDELNRKIYKLFINVNNSYEELLKSLEHSSQVEREILDLEDQVNTESQNKITDNLEKVLKDLTQIKEENEKIIAKIKSTK